MAHTLQLIAQKLKKSNIIGIRFIYIKKTKIYYNFKQKYAIDVSKAKATVVFISFVGVTNSPWGNCMIFQGKRAPDQFETKINRNKVINTMLGTHG